jgi:hypothetical protein
MRTYYAMRLIDNSVEEPCTALSQAAVEAIEEEGLPLNFTGTLTIELICNSGGVRDVWIQKRQRTKNK